MESALEVGELIDCYRQHVPQLGFYPGTRELLEDLRHRVLVGVISDGSAYGQRKKVESLGLMDLVDSVMLTDEQGRDYWKPSPAIFKRMCHEFGTIPSEAVYIGDNPRKDFGGPAEIGMLAIWSRHVGGFYTLERLTKDGACPDYTVDTVPELRELLWQLAPGVVVRPDDGEI